LEFGDGGFYGERKTREPGEMNPPSKAPSDNKLNPHMATGHNRTRTTLLRGRCYPCTPAVTIQVMFNRWMFKEPVKTQKCVYY